WCRPEPAPHNCAIGRGALARARERRAPGRAGCRSAPGGSALCTRYSLLALLVPPDERGVNGRSFSGPGPRGGPSAFVATAFEQAGVAGPDPAGKPGPGDPTAVGRPVDLARRGQPLLDARGREPLQLFDVAGALGPLPRAPGGRALERALQQVHARPALQLE